MKKSGRFLLIMAGLLLLLLLLGPFLIPVPPVEGTQPAVALADDDSLFLTIPWDGMADIQLHYKTAGEGEVTFVLLHGFASNLYTWDDVFSFFTERGTVFAYDRIPFGLSDRPLAGDWSDTNPYSPIAAREQLLAFLDVNEIEKAVLVGNSAGGTLAVSFALTYPDRVESLILVDAAIYTSGGAPSFIQPILNTPQMRRLGPLVSRAFAENEALFESAYHDPSRIDAESKEKAAIGTRVDDWDTAFWQFTLASQPLNLVPRLSSITLPTLVVTGDDDRIVPTEESLELARVIPNAELAVIAACGHVPHDECPDQFMEMVGIWLDGP